MIAILTAAAGFVVPATWAAFAGRGFAVLLLLAALAVPYFKGRNDGADACETRHTAARLEAEAERQRLEAEAARAAAIEDETAAHEEMTRDATAPALLDPAKCVDAEWVRDALSRLR